MKRLRVSRALRFIIYLIREDMRSLESIQLELLRVKKQLDRMENKLDQKK